jgi:hypothetical protein
LFNTDTDLLFPPRAIAALYELRGTPWQDLITAIVDTNVNEPDKMAFVLMMARMNGCATCNADSYRAMNGCTACSKQSLKRFHGTDDELLALFDSTKSEVDQFLK